MTKIFRPWMPVALAAATLGAAYATGALAETVVVNDQVTVRQTDIPRPKGGMLMTDVQKHFGEPRERHPTVGTPPITRWDYENFVVFFEKDRVIDSVVPGAAATPSAPGAAPIPAATPIPAAAPDSLSAPVTVATDVASPAAPPAATPAPSATPGSSSAAPASHDASAPKSSDGNPPLSNVALHP